jgi:hypothetical protein
MKVSFLQTFRQMHLGLVGSIFLNSFVVVKDSINPTKYHFYCYFISGLIGVQCKISTTTLFTYIGTSSATNPNTLGVSNKYKYTQCI